MDEENELIALRRKKLDALRGKGIEPFGGGFEVAGSIAEVREKFKEGEILRAAGRIIAHRDMGKSHFLDLRDATGRIQIYIHANEVGAELIDLFRLLDLGDLDRKSTRLNSSHSQISYAVFCLKKKIRVNRDPAPALNYYSCRVVSLYQPHYEPVIVCDNRLNHYQYYIHCGARPVDPSTALI